MNNVAWQVADFKNDSDHNRLTIFKIINPTDCWVGYSYLQRKSEQDSLFH